MNRCAVAATRDALADYPSTPMLPPTPRRSPCPAPTVECTAHFALYRALYEENPRTRRWLRSTAPTSTCRGADPPAKRLLPGGSIRPPLLRHGGTLFLTSVLSLPLAPADNWLIYGQQICAMVRCLANWWNYRDEDFTNAPHITFDTLYEHATWQSWPRWIQPLAQTNTPTTRFFDAANKLDWQRRSRPSRRLACTTPPGPGGHARIRHQLLPLSTCGDTPPRHGHPLRAILAMRVG